MERFIGIYMIINKRNSNIYIGASKNVLRRFIDHKCPCNLKKPNVIYRAFKKYGLSAFDFILLEEFDNPKKLPEREKYWIKKLNPEYNMNEGGLGNLGHEVTKEVRVILSKKAKIQWKNKTKDEKNKIINNNLSGRAKGYMLTEATKEKLRKINTGKKQSKATTLKRSKSMKTAMIGNKNGNKKIASYKNGIIVKTYNSVTEASKDVGVNASQISRALNGKIKTSAKFNWKAL
jgi:group I intron endonuclease